MQASESGPTASNRPDLLASSNGETAEGNRILAALEGGAGRGVSSKKRKAGGQSIRMRFSALLLLPTGVLAAWVIHHSTQTELHESANLAPKGNMHNVQLVASNLPPTDSFAPAEDAVAPQAALITDESSTQSVTSSKTPSNPTEPALNPISLEDSRTSTSTGALLEALEGRSTSPMGPSADPKPGIHKSNQAATAKKANQKTSSVKDARKRSPQRPKPKPRSKNDTDVALLTALVTVVNEPEKPTQSAPKLAEPGKAGNASNRDVVERTAHDSTESLLARCKRLGMLEGELCRWRICSGHDSDPACKVQ